MSFYVVEHIDSMILSGKRRLTEDGIATWCPVGRHWWVYPLPPEPDPQWLLDLSNAFIDDGERCQVLREHGVIELKHPWEC